MKKAKNSAKHHQILVSTFNVRTLSADHHLSELENALKMVKFDIIGLSEVKRDGEGTIDCAGFQFHYNGISSKKNLDGTRNKPASVGFIVHSRWKNSVTQLKNISFRVILIKVKVNKDESLGVVQAYAPTSKASDREIEAFYKDVEKAQIEIHDCTFKIIMGDWNAKVGSRASGTSNEADVMGFFGLGIRNERGERLIRFCRKHQLFITNTMFKKKPNKKWTWSLDLITRNEIDYILTAHKSCVKNVEVLNRFDFSSDHRMVRMTFELKKKLWRTKKQKRNNFFIDQRDETKIKEFNDRLRQSSVPEEVTVKDPLHNLKANFVEAAKVFTSRNHVSPVITPTTRDLIEKREKLRREAQIDLNMKNKYYDCRKLTKKEIRKDVRNFELLRIDVAIRENRGLKLSRDGIYKKRVCIDILTDEKGEEIRDKLKISEFISEFYSKLFSKTDSSVSENSPNIFVQDETPVPVISLEELKFALSAMKYSKAKGPDDFPIDLLKISDDKQLIEVTKVFNEFLTTESLPNEWFETNIILIFKKGRKDKIENYRPISLISHLYKLFIKIILNRIDDVLEENQSIEQSGFRKGFSTSDNLVVINQLIEKFKEFNKPLHIAFIDYEKAFDSVNHDFLKQTLFEQNVPRKYIRLFDLIYNNSTAKIITEVEGLSFNIKRGVKQGDPSSPKLFNAVIEKIFQSLDWSFKGISIDSGKLHSLRFADDVFVISESKQELLSMIKDLNHKSAEAGLKINRKKTVILSNSDVDDYEIGDWKLEKVEEYKYLGQIVSFTDSMTKEIEARISAAWRNFWAHKRFLMSELPMWHKRKLMDGVILPTFTWGAQTWNLSKEHQRRLCVEQRTMERKILKISPWDHVTNEEIRSITKIKDVLEKARELKWDFAGHVQRLHDERWAKRVTNWTPKDGKRKIGHQLKRWSDDIEAVGLGRWKIKANNRIQWKNMRETYVHKD